MGSEFGRIGGQLPHNPDLEAERERDIREATAREHKASELLEAHRRSDAAASRRPWWAFWRRARPSR